ncbi:hypothetical protein AB0K80_23900 [Streptomyces sp. NPDC052682]|uniref:hypothetical protein n=1 Tax=Streptomyces sp. NPDC052682 TaxID=3154954 RepID=UPI00342B62B8
MRTVDTHRGGLLLGHGDYTMTYPAGPDAGQYRRGQAVVLHRSNHLSRYDARRGVTAGDTALLGWFNGGLHLHGLPGRRVRPARLDGHYWPGADWLHDALTGPAPDEAVGALGGALPVTVEEPDEDGTLVVSRRLQPTSALSRGGLLRTEAVAALGPALVLRSGPALHLLPVQDVVPGIPEGHRAQAAALIARSRHLVWLRISGTPGRRLRVEARLDVPEPRPYADEYDAVPFAVVGPEDHPAGLLVRTPHDEGLRWLPVGLLSWAEALTTAEIRAAFPAEKCALHVRSQHDGTVSAAGVRRVYRARRDLTLGARLRAEPLDVPGPESAGGGLALAQPHGMLVRLGKNPVPGTNGEAILVEVAALGTQDTTGVRVVPLGSRLLTLDLPGALVCGSRAAAAAHIAGLAERHRQWLLEGLDAGGLPETGRDPAESVDAAVLRAWSHAARATGGAAGTDDGLALDRRGIDHALRQWVTTHGEDAFGLRQEAELGLAETLAACLLMRHVGEADPLLARGAVLLAHQTGLRAGRSLHVEPVVRLWATADGQGTGQAGSPLEARLADLDLPGTVDRVGLEEILRFGHGVLGRVDADGPAHRLTAAARAVLVSVGQLSADMDLRAGAPVLSLVADLGRALHPPQDEAVAQPALSAAQTYLLRALLTRVVGKGPLFLLPVPARLPGVAERLAREVIAWGG